MNSRPRSIKPEVLEDAVTAGLSDMAFRLFIAVLVLSDDYGRFRAEPQWLRKQIYWSRDVTPSAFAAALDEIGCLVDLYAVNGQRYGEVRNWAKHQRIDRPGQPRIPQRVTDSRLDSTHREMAREPCAGVVTPLATDLDMDMDQDLEGDQDPAPERTTETRIRLPTKLKRTATRIPSDWTVGEQLTTWATREGISARDVQDIADRFRDHWLASPATNRNAVKADWDAAFRTWTRRDVADGRVVAMPPRPPEPVLPPPTEGQLDLRRKSQSIVAAAIAEMDSRHTGRTA